MGAFDWDQFKKDIAHLNEPRTQEERADIIHKEAKKSWRVASNQDTSIFRYSVHPETKFKTPSSLETLAAIAIKKQMFIKQYTDLIENMTLGNENIYPEQWNWDSLRIRNKIIMIQHFKFDKISKIANTLSTKDLREEDGIVNPPLL
jgi:hypothetical protein